MGLSVLLLVGFERLYKLYCYSYTCLPLVYTMHNCFYIMLDLAYSSYFFGRHKILDLARSDWLFKKAEANKSKINKNKLKDEKK